MEGQYYKLSRNEIDFIIGEVKKNEISFSRLEDELIDHLCCMVEELINDGYTFKAAFETVRKNVGFDSLKAIEIQTIILINKKFQTMRKTLKISGIIGLSAIIISSILKLNHWPGAGPLLVLGFVTLLFSYLPALFLTLRKEKIMKRKMNLSYAGILTAFILLINMLFTLMAWPYKEYTFVVAWLLMLVFLVMLFNNIMKSEENRVLNLSLLLFFSIVLIIDVTLNLLPLRNPQLSKYTIENNIEANIKLYEHKTEKTYKLLGEIANNPNSGEIAEIRTKTSGITDKIGQIRDAIFTDKAEQENFNKRFFKNYEISNDIEKKAKKLESEISEYNKFMIEKSVSQPELNSFIEGSIQFSILEFNNINPQVIYNNLQRLIRDIKIAESDLLSEIQSSKFTVMN